MHFWRGSSGELKLNYSVGNTNKNVLSILTDEYCDYVDVHMQMLDQPIILFTFQ